MYDFLIKNDEFLNIVSLLCLFFLIFTWVKGFKYDQAVKSIDHSYQGYHSVKFRLGFNQWGPLFVVFPKYIKANYDDELVIKLKKKYHFNLTCFWISGGLIVISLAILFLGP